MSVLLSITANAELTFSSLPPQGLLVPPILPFLRSIV